MTLFLTTTKTMQKKKKTQLQGKKEKRKKKKRINLDPFLVFARLLRDSRIEREREGISDLDIS